MKAKKLKFGMMPDIELSNSENHKKLNLH